MKIRKKEILNTEYIIKNTIFKKRITNNEKRQLISWSVYSEFLARLTPVMSLERVCVCLSLPCVLSYLLLGVAISLTFALIYYLLHMSHLLRSLFECTLQSSFNNFSCVSN